MKRINLIITILLAAILVSCTKEDEGKINAVSDVTTTPFIGSVKITFNIPSDKDYYYTLINYKDSKGNAMNKKVSVYDAVNGITTATIGGFTDTDEHEFSLTAHGFSGVSSSAVTVKGTPEDISTAIDYVIGTVDVKALDMGAQVSWTNESGVPVNLIATYKDSKGNDKTVTMDAEKTDSTTLTGFITTTDISILAKNVSDGKKSETKTYTITPNLPPDDIIQDEIEYITLNTGTNNDCTTSQEDTENPYEYKIVTSGGDPNTNANPFSNPIAGKTLKFRYKASQAFDLELFWCDPGGGAAGGRSTVVPIPAASDWTTFTHDYSDAMAQYSWQGIAGCFFRMDWGGNSNVTIYIRNMHFE
jgi:hypothetical protein